MEKRHKGWKKKKKKKNGETFIRCYNIAVKF